MSMTVFMAVFFFALWVFAVAGMTTTAAVLWRKTWGSVIAWLGFAMMTGVAVVFFSLALGSALQVWLHISEDDRRAPSFLLLGFFLSIITHVFVVWRKLRNGLREHRAEAKSTTETPT